MLNIKRNLRQMRINKLRLTADKRLRYASPKLPSPTSFSYKPLGEMRFQNELRNEKYEE